MKLDEINKVETKLNKHFRLIIPSIDFKIICENESNEMIITAFWDEEKTTTFYCKISDYQNYLEFVIKPYFLNQNSEFDAK